MAQARAVSPPHRLGFFATLRKDRWWVEPALIAAGLTVFLGYLTIGAFLDGWHYEVGPYLSPVFEPKLHGAFSQWWFSPALLILWVPVGFRATCYYYRRAYYRSYFLSPPACAVGDAAPAYKGETIFPFILQNAHRFFMYGALVFAVLLWIGAIRGFHDPDEGWGVGLGSAILCVNAFNLMMYTFSCHSFRHFVGGGLDCFSCSAWTRGRKRVWDYVSLWNQSHRFWAWLSLVWIAGTDVYIRLVANGDITDPNTWHHF
ncbi:MAG TPA: succinate dehydrogenase [Dehalococcoidia bacterium]|nr:succinate dehydrogenase [Dehalococcoidia bacterium]